MNQLSLTLSIIIVSFNTKEQLGKCLSCLDDSRYQVIVVDNGSIDGSVEMVRSTHPKVILIQNEFNLGFGRANNVGLERATGDLILYLNSDAYASSASIESLTAVFEDSNVVAAGPRLLNTDGTLQESVAARLTLWNVFLEQSFLDFVARRLGLGYWRTRQLPTDRTTPVEQVMGACFMVRASAQERFDERFFLYCEDTELCLRLRTHGEILYVPAAEVTHELGSSSVDSRWKSVARYNLGKELYFRIHQGSVAAVGCGILNKLGAFLRLAAGVLLSPFTRGGREKVRVFWRVLFATRADVIPREHIGR